MGGGWNEGLGGRELGMMEIYNVAGEGGESCGLLGSGKDGDGCGGGDEFETGYGGLGDGGGGGSIGLGGGNGDELGCRGMGGGGEFSLAGGEEPLSGDEGGTACRGCTTGISTEPMQWIPCMVIGSANTAVQGSPVMIPRNGRGSWQKVGKHCASGKPLQVAWAQGSIRQCTPGSFLAHCT